MSALLIASLVALPDLSGPADNYEPARPNWVAWAAGISNADMYFMTDPGAAFVDRDETFEAEYERIRWCLNLPVAERVALCEALLASLHDPRRFAAAHVAVAKLHTGFASNAVLAETLRRDRYPLFGRRTWFGLEVEFPQPWDRPQAFVYDIRKDGDAARERHSYLGEYAVFPRPRAQMARLRRWWREYFAGERRAFMVRGKDRPETGYAADKVFRKQPLLVQHAYRTTLPPEPPDLATMTPLEVEAYYGAMPDLSDPEIARAFREAWDDTDRYADDLFPEIRPPPAPGWEARVGLPPLPAPEPAPDLRED